MRAPPENWIGKFVWLSRWENWKCSMMLLHAKGTIHDVTRCLSWYCQFPRQFFLAVKRPSWPVKLRLSAFNQVKFHLPFASRSMQFDLTFILSWRDFLDCLTFKIDDIILFEQGKHLLINIISIEIFWDNKLIRFSQILYFLELLYFQNICNLFFLYNKEFIILETYRF